MTARATNHASGGSAAQTSRRVAFAGILLGSVAVVPGCARTVVPFEVADGGDACGAGADARLRRSDFEGVTLGPEWTQDAVGEAPAYGLDGGWLEITDAALADTPSAGNTRSWIYDPAMDLGNQMAWTQPIGADDFDATFDLAWSSTVSELTLAGVGLTNADHQLEVFGGFIDPWVSQLGGSFARIRTANTTVDWYGDLAPSGQVRMRLARHDGVVTVTVDGREVVHAPNSADLRAVSVFSVRHRDPRGTYDFGRVAFHGLEVCY